MSSKKISGDKCAPGYFDLVRQYIFETLQLPQQKCLNEQN